MTLNLYQTGLQVILKAESPKYNLYQSGLQVILQARTPKYNLYQSGLQVIIRPRDTDPYAAYTVSQLPLEIAYAPESYLIFDSCIDQSYFFAADHNITLYEGESLLVRLLGGVPPYTWAVDVGSTLVLSATETDVPYVYISQDPFVLGVEYLTVEDACGNQLVICVYKCRKIDCVDLVCESGFSCDDSCNREIIPWEPPDPSDPPPDPHIPIFPPEPPDPPLPPPDPPVEPPPPGTPRYILTTELWVNGTLVGNGDWGEISPGGVGYLTGDNETVILSKEQEYSFDGWTVTQSFTPVELDENNFTCDVVFGTANITVRADLSIERELTIPTPFTSFDDLYDFLGNINLIVITVSGSRDICYLLWDLAANMPLVIFGVGPIVTKLEWENSFLRYFTLIEVPDCLEESNSVGLPSINKWQVSDSGLNLPDFGYPVEYNREWGCGNAFTMALFVPMWCEDGTVAYGHACITAWNQAGFHDCYIMGDWDTTLSGSALRGGQCDLVSFHVWPSDIRREDRYSYKSSVMQSLSGEIDIIVDKLSCPPCSYTKLRSSDIRITPGKCDRSVWAKDTAIAAHIDHGYISDGLSKDSGDWGSVVLRPVGEYALGSYYGYVRTAFDYMCFSSTYPSGLITPTTGCEDFATGWDGPASRGSNPSELASFEYYTWWGPLGSTFTPTMMHTLEEVEGHRVWRSVHDWEFQSHIFVRQRTENRKRKINVHASIGKEFRGFPPMRTGRRYHFEQKVKELFYQYYSGWKTDDYLPGSKIDPYASIKVYRADLRLLFRVYQLPLEVAYEKT